MRSRAQDDWNILCDPRTLLLFPELCPLTLLRLQQTGTRYFASVMHK
ncbi:mCG62109 [Mus musculus]|nr:mCG62109 [Mus musculus]